MDGIKINEASDNDDDNYDCDNNNDSNDEQKNIIQRWGCLTIIWIIGLVYFLNCNTSVWLTINVSFAVPVFIFLMKLHRDLDVEKIPIGCLMYCILEIIAFVFMMHCTDSFWIALFFSLTVPVGVFSALAQSSGNS